MPIVTPFSRAHQSTLQGFTRLVGTALLCLAGSLVQAQDSPKSQKPATVQAAKAMTQDAAPHSQLAKFLRDYHHALHAGDHKFLSEHTVFPLPFAKAVYDMEAKPHDGKLRSVAELVKAKETLLWPKELVPAKEEDLAALQRGVEKCRDPKGADVPDFGQGGPAIAVSDDEATLTYLAEPCAAETHVVTLTFARKDKTWRLRSRTISMGPH